MTRVGFELQTSCLVAYVVPCYVTDAAGMMALSRLYKPESTRNSHSVIGCVYATLEVTYMAAVYKIAMGVKRKRLPYVYSDENLGMDGISDKVKRGVNFWGSYMRKMPKTLLLRM